MWHGYSPTSASAGLQQCDLLFDRFLTHVRKRFPDIDVDYPQSQRPNIKQYLAARHGHDHVCGCGTRSRSGPKQTMRDLRRAMGISFADTNETVALIEDVEGVDAEIEVDLDGEPPTWKEVLEGRGSALAEWAGKYSNLFEEVNEMTSLVRQAGTHAAGILIANQPLLLDWPLLGGLEFSSCTQPRRETYTGAVDVATTQQPRSKALLISSSSIWLYPLFGDMRLLKMNQEHGRYGPRRHLSSDSASETKIRVDHLY
jgi:Bacterial DNA polymerase III alpha NTPase domain